MGCFAGWECISLASGCPRARHGCDLPMCIHTSSSLRWRGEVLYPTRLVGWRAAAFVGAGWRMFELYNVSLIFCSLADPGASDI